MNKKNQLQIRKKIRVRMLPSNDNENEEVQEANCNLLIQYK